MNRRGKVYYKNKLAGYIEELDDMYVFKYSDEYLKNSDAMPISLTMPLTDKTYNSKTMFPFFDGLIPEGWLLDITVETWKLDPRDRMGLLLAVCKDTIGAVWIEEEIK